MIAKRALSGAALAACLAWTMAGPSRADIAGFGDGAGFQINHNANVTPTIVAGTLTLTTNAGSQTASAFFTTPQSTGDFDASFVYQASGDRVADGAALVFQNDPAGPGALGIGGASLGYSGIAHSAAVEFNILAARGVGTNYATQGAAGTYLDTSPVSLASGDPILIQLALRGSSLTETLTDQTTHATFATAYTGVDLAGATGGSSAFVGFTGGTGAGISTQTISAFSFTTRAVPEPTALALLALGGVPLLLAARRRGLRRPAAD